MNAAIESALFLALAVALASATPSRRGLAAAALLLAAAAPLPVRAPCTLAAAVLVAADGARVALAFPLLASACVGLAAIAAPGATPAMAGALAAAIGGRVVVASLGQRPRPHALASAGARAALGLALAAELAGAHRLAPLVKTSATSLAAALGLVAFALAATAHGELATRRREASVRRGRGRDAHGGVRADVPQASSASCTSPLTSTATAHEGAALVEALKRIVHELRQPVGAAANALATATLAATPANVRDDLRALASAELASALDALEALARLSRAGAGETLRMPARDAVIVALGAHGDAVDLAADCDDALEVDPSQLGRALDALVANALDARTGSRVRVEAARDHDALVLRVVDDGVAPPMAELARAAEPFFTTRAGRLGIGATAAAAFARASGGSLVWRREEPYTVAELRIPLARPRPTSPS